MKTTESEKRTYHLKGLKFKRNYSITKFLQSHIQSQLVDPYVPFYSYIGLDRTV